MIQLDIPTQSRDQALDVTGIINKAIADKRWQRGMCNIFVPHTTAAITINEGCDPSVMHDVLNSFSRLIPWRADYTHPEGNSAAHIKSILVGVSLSVPVETGRLALGQWQKVFFMEFDGPRKRGLRLTFSQA